MSVQRSQGLIKTWYSTVQKRHLQTASSLQMVELDTIVNLCKKKGFVFQSSEIYNPMAGLYDFGPLGVELKNNIKRIWWKNMVQNRDDVYGLDSSIIASPKIWEASGHVAGFSDPMVDCKDSKLRFRADQVYWSEVRANDSRLICYVTVVETDNLLDVAAAEARRLAIALGFTGNIQQLDLKDLTEAPSDLYHLLPSPVTGKVGALTTPRDFNLMFKTSIGAVTDESSVAYLRPETAQGIFTNFAAVQRSARAKVPFGIAQIGKAFRNELTPKNFIFRSREFEQMELEYFIHPDEAIWNQVYLQWIRINWNWLKLIGLREDLMTLQEHSKDKLAHYAKACTDILFKFPFGSQELMGIAARGNFDLQQHSLHSGKVLEYQDPLEKRKFIPHVVEPSIGIDRLFLALLVSSYREEELNGENRVVLGLHPALAPIKVVVLPLVSNNAELLQLSRRVARTLRRLFVTDYDISGGIGKRYRRADEAGTPFCVTVDFDSLKDQTVTIRERDSMNQERLAIAALPDWISIRVADPILADGDNVESFSATTNTYFN